jgi:sugar/nucleoside kinase (ribokinase family)
MYNYDALIGFSVNPEFIFSPKREIVSRRLYRKIPYDLKRCVSGTSFDTAVAMRKMGKQVRVLGAVGLDDPLNYLIQGMLTKYEVETALWGIRKETALAVVDIDKGRKSRSFKLPIIRVPKKEIENEILNCQPALKVVTGLSADPKEIEMAKIFFRGTKGAQVLNPRISLTAQKRIFRQLLGRIHLLILNDFEAGQYFGKERQRVGFKDLEEFHDFGVVAVILTCDVRGAMLSTFDGEKIFQPKINAGKLVDETGAGDCFLGFFLGAKLEGMTNQEAMKFAAAAAALKITLIGGSSMPERKEVEKILKGLP